MTVEVETTTKHTVEVQFPLYYVIIIGGIEYMHYFIPSPNEAYIVSKNDGIQRYISPDLLISRFFSSPEGTSVRQLTKAEFDAHTQQVADHFLKLITDRP